MVKPFFLFSHYHQNFQYLNSKTSLHKRIMILFTFLLSPSSLLPENLSWNVFIFTSKYIATGYVIVFPLFISVHINSLWGHKMDPTPVHQQKVENHFTKRRNIPFLLATDMRIGAQRADLIVLSQEIELLLSSSGIIIDSFNS